MKNGKIIKFKNFSTGRYSRYRGEDLKNVKTIIDFKRCHYKYDNIVKHSKNIIDLIEKGDYVKVESEGYEITGIVDLTIPPLKIFIDGEEYLEDEIKSIVTKESLKNVEYKVED